MREVTERSGETEQAKPAGRRVSDCRVPYDIGADFSNRERPSVVQKGKHEQLMNEPGIYADFVGGKKQAVGWKL